MCIVTEQSLLCFENNQYAFYHFRYKLESQATLFLAEALSSSSNRAKLIWHLGAARGQPCNFMCLFRSVRSTKVHGFS